MRSVDTLRLATLLLLPFLTACGDESSRTISPGPDAVEVPSWAKAAPEQIAEAEKHGVPVAFENDLGMRFVLIPAGTFLMGSPEDEEGHEWNERHREVTISRPFYMSIYEVTNEQYRKGGVGVKADDPDSKKKPAVHVTWNWAMSFASWLSETPADRLYTLPTDAQWEYACRAGTTTAYAHGERLTPNQARFGEPDPVPVGSYPPNAWGLHDMHGNAAEWCLDRSGPYETTASVDPTGTEDRRYSSRVLRGGDFRSPMDWARCAARDNGTASSRGTAYGIRLVSPLPEPGE